MEAGRTKRTEAAQKSCQGRGASKQQPTEEEQQAKNPEPEKDKGRDGGRGGQQHSGGGGEPTKPTEEKGQQTALNIIYLNARSIVSKLNELEILANEKSPDLILICESWCNSSINNALLSLNNYHLEPNLRHDRCDTQFGIGGGLLVYVKNGLHILPIDNEFDFNQYCTFNVINDNDSNILTINLMYRSPNSNNENLDKLCNVLEKVKENEFNMIIGDFNMPDIDWKNYQSKNSKYSRFLNIVNQKSFHQIIDFPTHSKGNILDIVLTNNPDCILNVESFGNLSNIVTIVLLVLMFYLNMTIMTNVI